MNGPCIIYFSVYLSLRMKRPSEIRRKNKTRNAKRHHKTCLTVAANHKRQKEQQNLPRSPSPPPVPRSPARDVWRFCEQKPDFSEIEIHNRMKSSPVKARPQTSKKKKVKKSSPIELFGFQEKPTAPRSPLKLPATGFSVKAQRRHCANLARDAIKTSTTAKNPYKLQELQNSKVSID